MARRARDMNQERIIRGNPADWGGLSEEELKAQSANDDISIRRREKLIFARRSDAFQALHSSGGLSQGEFNAGQRYFEAWSIRAGAGDPPPAGTEIVDGGRGCAELITGRMVRAGRELEYVHQEIGRADTRLLTHLVEPLVMRGEVRVWRELVRLATGETERHAQAARVRGACANLVLAWPVVDLRICEPPRRPAA